MRARIDTAIRMRIMRSHQIGRAMTAETLNGTMIFGTADELIAAMFGPPQHDAHLKPWRWHNFCRDIYGFTPDYSRKIGRAA